MGALRRQAAGLVAIVAALILVALFTPHLLQQWRDRPTSAACRARTFDVTLAGLGLKVPASPLLTLSTGKSADGGYGLADARRLRDFCDQAPPGRPKRITAIRLNLDPTGPCRTAHDRIAAIACPDAGRWTKAAIYSPAEFDHLALGSSLGAYESFRRERAVTEVNEAPMEAVRLGAFERYPDGFWVAPDWITASGEPVAISCGPDRAQAGWLACTATHAVGAGLQATVDFHAPEAEVEATARRIEADLTLLLAGFAPGQGLGMTPTPPPPPPGPPPPA